jgi:hypothetical protein
LPDVHYGNAEHFVDDEADTGISKWCLTGTDRDGHKVEVPSIPPVPNLIQRPYGKGAIW